MDAEIIMNELNVEGTTFLDPIRPNVIVAGSGGETRRETFLKNILLEFISKEDYEQNKFVKAALATHNEIQIVKFKHGGKDALVVFFSPYSGLNIATFRASVTDVRIVDSNNKVSLSGYESVPIDMVRSGYYQHYCSTSHSYNTNQLYRILYYYDNNQLQEWYTAITANTPYYAWNLYWIVNGTSKAYYRINPYTLESIGSSYYDNNRKVSIDTNTYAEVYSTIADVRLVVESSYGIKCIKNIPE